ncbi:uncharacterized protein LOC107039464 [Diachasma alloeum]|uniref:uncharacterized protein LOC107039464 n=1 Tax=Diachasma alloeum TaxID=454923 RepID=UPI00073846A8|nr:uncharacterized protein LOC107039464 [Diachasma alloeum]
MSSAKKPPPNPQYKRFKYSDESMKKAIEAVKNGQSLSNAASAYSVPKTTLHSRVTGKFSEKGKMGPKSILTEEEEQDLKRWILGKAQLGFPMHPDEVKDAVQKILLESPRENPFKNNRPGNKWLTLFMKRHPEISTKNSEIVSRAKITVTQEGLKEWFIETRSFLTKKHCLDVLDLPGSIFYVEESGVLVCPKSGVILGPKSERRTSETSGTEKEFITVLCTFSAAGDIVPPMVVYPYKRIPTHIQVLFPDKWTIAKSETGLIATTTFQDYVIKSFHPWCLKENVQFPVIIFTHSQKHHVTAELHEFCVKNEIIIYSLPLHSTGMMRRFDSAVLKPLRNFWKRKIDEGKQPGVKAITKTTFAPLCKRSIDEFLGDERERIIKEGFKIVGLFPFDENAVDYSKCLPEAAQEKISESLIMMRDYKSAKKVIEYFIGPVRTNLFESIRNGDKSEDSLDPLFLCWNMCVDKVEEVESIEVDEDLVAQEDDEEEENADDGFHYVF